MENTKEIQLYYCITYYTYCRSLSKAVVVQVETSKLGSKPTILIPYSLLNLTDMKWLGCYSSSSSSASSSVSVGSSSSSVSCSSSPSQRAKARTRSVKPPVNLGYVFLFANPCLVRSYCCRCIVRSVSLLGKCYRTLALRQRDQ